MRYIQGPFSISFKIVTVALSSLKDNSFGPAKCSAPNVNATDLLQFKQ